MSHQNPRIKLTDSIQSVITKMAEGNPGAAIAMIELVEKGAAIDPDSAWGGWGALMSLDTADIYGSGIYVLFSDICDRDPAKTIAVLRACQLGILPEATLKDACSRQDRSGKQIINPEDLYKKVKEELPNFNPQG